MDEQTTVYLNLNHSQVCLRSVSSKKKNLYLYCQLPAHAHAIWTFAALELGLRLVIEVVLPSFKTQLTFECLQINIY